jgi:hypothetical protein
LALARKPTYKTWLHPSARRPNSSLSLPAHGEKPACAAEASTHSWRGRSARPVAPFARTEQPLRRIRLPEVEAQCRPKAVGFRVRPSGGTSSQRLLLRLLVVLPVEMPRAGRSTIFGHSPGDIVVRKNESERAPSGTRLSAGHRAAHICLIKSIPPRCDGDCSAPDTQRLSAGGRRCWQDAATTAGIRR